MFLTGFAEAWACPHHTLPLGVSVCHILCFFCKQSCSIGFIAEWTSFSITPVMLHFLLAIISAKCSPLSLKQPLIIVPVIFRGAADISHSVGIFSILSTCIVEVFSLRLCTLSYFHNSITARVPSVAGRQHQSFQ